MEDEYKKAYLREKKARAHAEILLELKSGELYEINQALLESKEALEKDVLERTAELLKAKTQAEDLAQVKSEFLSMMSHEIKTPLNAILGYAQLAEIEKENALYIKNILSSSEVLINTINDILLFSKIESGKLKSTVSVISLKEEVSKILPIFGVISKEKNIKLTTRFSDNLEELIITDKQKLVQVLLNLIGNACKFTKDGSVEVCATLDRLELGKDLAKLSVSIKDTGQGIPESVMQKLFEPFVQAEDTGQFLYEGTGLGLTITKRLLDLLGGEISVKSTEGEGSEFLIAMNVDIFNKEIPIEKQQTDIDMREFSGQKEFRHKVLVVEDNKINQDLILRMLKRYDLSVDIANNGLEAYNLFLKNQNHYDIIFMDIRMPVMDGYTASEKITAVESTKKPRIIALSANQFSDVGETSLDRNFDDFVKKPFKIQDLEAIFIKYPVLD
jgi:signal transduction histidine kinase